ncbi:hypothetical protein ACLOJK_040186 [Asimina triloba]
MSISKKAGPNPLFGSLKSTTSIFGRSSYTWIEGDGMLHAVYFKRDSEGNWSVSYKNRYVESETYKVEKGREKPSFLPAIEGDSHAILAAFLLNHLRFGKVNKDISNTNVFQHSGKCYAIAENYIPQEIDVATLRTLGSWDINGDWDRPFTSHPKKAPGSGELVIIGVEPKKPFLVLGVISADGKRLPHKVDLEFKRCILCHEIGITEKYNIIMDVPLTLDLNRLVQGGPLLKYEGDSYARIGVMPRYGNADSIKWFELEPHCTFHILNCFEDGHEVVVRGCRAPWSIVPGLGRSKSEFSSQKSDVQSAEELFFSCAYEWRVNIEIGDVKEKNLTGTDLTMDMPFINDKFTGLRNAYGYTLVADSYASSECGLPKYGSLAKLYFEEKNKTSKSEEGGEDRIKVEYHLLEENQFCSGAAFVSKQGGLREDDGWVISFVHSEDTNISQVHIIDAQKFERGPVAKITLPQRVPYGFHGTFISETNSMPASLRLAYFFIQWQFFPPHVQNES